MSKSCNKNSAPRNGTNRLNRLPQALDASFVAIDERNKEALYEFTKRLSTYINYHYFDGISQVSNWETIFNISDINVDGFTEPHLALFDAFLDLYAVAQRDLNQFTARHLDYFFETILGFERKPASPDKVYLTIELAKHISQYLLKDNIEFKAGKNSDKKEQFYKLLSDFSFSHAQVGSIKSILVDAEEKSIISISPVANSGDGKGGEINNQDKSWAAFGTDKREKAKIGFAISTPLLRMAEGTRKITLEIQFVGGYNTTPSISENSFKALISAEKGWEEINVISAKFLTTSILQLVVLANESNQKIVDYNPKLHLDDFRTLYPVLKLELVAAKGLYNTLMFAAVDKIHIITEVKGIKNLLVQNSLGKLDASKPMEIFGSTPTIGANFYIGSSEVFQHELKTLNLNFEFLNLPGMAFNNYYKLYAEPAKLFEFLPLVMMQTTSFASSSSNPEMVSKGSDLETKPVADVKATSKTIADAATSFYSGQMLSVIPKYWEKEEFQTLFSNYVTNSSFQAEITYLNHRNWLPLMPAIPQKVNLFGTADANPPTAQFSANLSIPTELKLNYSTNAGEGYDLNSERGFLKMKFTNGKFGHADYQLAYSRAVLNNVKEDLSTLELPNAPYTPLIQNLSLDYSAEALIDLKPSQDSTVYNNRIHKFLSITPFGQAEVHPYTSKGVVYLLPNLSNEGELYIGLTDAIVPQNISLLFLVSEGSSNPDYDKAIVRWSYLQNNIWEEFKKTEILREQTNGLLTTGIVTLSIPKTVNSHNTVLPTAFVWLKVSVEKDVLAICNIISITAQVAEAQFSFYDDVVPENVAIEPGIISKLKEPDKIGRAHV